MTLEKKKSDHTTDEELIARFQKGDTSAFEEIVKRFKDQLVNFSYRFLLRSQQSRKHRRSRRHCTGNLSQSIPKEKCIQEHRQIFNVDIHYHRKSC